MDLNQAIQATWDKIGSWLAGAIQALPNLVVAVVIVVVFVLIARFARDWSYRLLGRVSEYRAVNRLLSTLAFVALLALGATIALTVLNLGTAVASILGAAGILGLAIGFAAQNTVENLIAGILISVRRPIREGDLVEAHDVFGRVQEINLRATVLLTPTGQLVYVPNGEVFRAKLINYTKLGQRRVDLTCGVSYADDLEAVRRVTIEAVEDVPQRIQGKDVEFYYEEFGGSSINFVVRFWIPFTNRHSEYKQAQTAAIMALKTAFDENDISIPFPIRTLDFGILGGVGLSEELREARAADGGTG
ncbi:MAG TPA: mechanosensitive ion channel family protein [Gemmatimonadota bacterium]|nr:mechanosensitive ion channel family protein [Gemmatimonadota bacterium]